MKKDNQLCTLCTMNASAAILHERKLAVIFNYAYEVTGEGLVSDAVYEHGLANLRELRDAFPTEWQECPFYKEYFLLEDWEYTGSGVPRTEESRALYESFKQHGRAL